MKKPFLSIIIPTRNASGDLPSCLQGIVNQTYKNLEIFVVDGRSIDNTRMIAKKFGAIVIDNPKIFAEPGIVTGMKKAKGELYMILAVDNVYNSFDSVEKMVRVFANKNIYAAFPKQDSDLSDTLYSKYINTFTDPFNHFIYGNASNPRTFNKVYQVVKKTKNYIVYNYSSSSVKPILALAQGFTVRRQFADLRQYSGDDIAPVMEIVKQKKQIAYVSDAVLIHHTIRNTSQFVRKIRWATRNALNKSPYGIAIRQSTLTRYQRLKTYMFPLYGLSLIIPLIRSLYEYRKSKEKIWLFHPIIALLCSIAIAYETIIIKFGIHSDTYRH